jgi:hypothetical protein
LRPGFGGSDEGLKPYVGSISISDKVIVSAKREDRYLIEPFVKMEFTDLSLITGRRAGV